ncbi:MAG: hypothetical protein WA140_04825 [Geobacteraceae bacterium]
MKYLLDTDTCVFWLKGNERIEQKVLSDPGLLLTPDYFDSGLLMGDPGATEPY